MSPLTQRIEDAQKLIVDYRDKLAAHLASYDDSNVTDDQLTVTQELNSKIATVEKSRNTLLEAEKRLAATAEPPQGGTALVPFQAPQGQSALTVRAVPFAQPAQKI